MIRLFAFRGTKLRGALSYKVPWSPQRPDPLLLFASGLLSCNDTEISSLSKASDSFNSGFSSLQFWGAGDDLPAKLEMNWCSTFGAPSNPFSMWNSGGTNRGAFTSPQLVQFSGSTGTCWMPKQRGPKFSSALSLNRTRSGAEDSPTAESIAVAEAFLCSCTAAALSKSHVM